MKLALALVVLLLAGCASYKETEARDIDLHIHWVPVENFTQVKKVIGANPFADAFAKWYDDEDGRHCYIFMPKPSTPVGTFILGHELLHCTDGDFH